MRSPIQDNPAPDTATWYDDHARSFFDETVEIELPHSYDAFLPRIPPGGAILDAGCGSGRDSKRFAEMGYQVEAFDASQKMIDLARQHSNLNIRRLEFQDVDFPPRFDGVFANASLLHVPTVELPGILKRLAAALKPAGVFFASFKHGQGEYFKDEQLYVCLQDETSLKLAVTQCELLTLQRTWTTPDNRPGRSSEQWLHMLGIRNLTLK
ncbi:class I SAM-dependent methyltransferase [Desulfovibrio ferrophilus]|uniref:Tellurite resistance protein n=1 Tax=Desulfovibrio ferrophilus TaxID=241368 RepID=A0A2Z6AZR8_9BACT|nr:class I SAM-dependent methyltransferase [Desulfovibrio ferrophilus]BBD08690.1 tellurite resistance protein [Desulfovibrio ferrophilus]